MTFKIMILPNLVDVFNDGDIEALHKHTGLPFTYKHVLLMSIDSTEVGRRSQQKTLDGKGFQKIPKNNRFLLGKSGLHN